MTSRLKRLQADIDMVRARAEAISADLQASAYRRGTPWYDDRVREIHALRRSAADRETRLNQITD